jgi:DNA-binding response OmpR family regulator
MSILQGKKILVVDDELGPRESIHMVLRGLGAFVIKAESGEDALTILKHNKFDLITTCLRMDGMNGLDLCREIKERGITTPIMIISGQGSDFAFKALIITGAIDYISKPVNINDLIIRMEKVLLVPLKVSE